MKKVLLILLALLLVPMLILGIYLSISDCGISPFRCGDYPTPANAFQNNGDLISAASTALFINNRLYISQVFDPFVLVVEGIE